MSSLRRIDLEFDRAAVHHVATRFKTQEHGASLPENDTIVSAAGVAWLNVTGEFPHKWFDETGACGIACSSLLPTLKDSEGEPKLYLPIPPKSLRLDNDSQLHLLKIVNKVSWLREDVWQEWAEGDWRGAAKKVIDDYFDSAGGKSHPPVALSRNDPKWVKKSVQERVTLHPYQLKNQALADADGDIKKAEGLMKASMPYRVTSFRFEKNAGAALIIEDDEDSNQFVKALSILGEIGLGGDRTYGYGQFRVALSSEYKRANTAITEADASLTLGLLCPGNPPQEPLVKPLTSEDSRWAAVNRQGRNKIAGTNCTVLTKSVRMVGGGALFEGCQSGAVGCAVNVFPDTWDPELQGLPPFSDIEFWSDRKRIWRSGRTVALPARLHDNGGDV